MTRKQIERTLWMAGSCISCAEGEWDTRKARTVEAARGKAANKEGMRRGWRWIGIPCSHCAVTWDCYMYEAA